MWGADASSFYYLTMDEQHRPCRVWRHTLGQPQSTDALLLEEADEAFWVSLSRSATDEYVLVDAASKTTSEVHAVPLTQRGGGAGAWVPGGLGVPPHWHPSLPRPAPLLQWPAARSARPSSSRPARPTCSTRSTTTGEAGGQGGGFRPSRSRAWTHAAAAAAGRLRTTSLSSPPTPPGPRTARWGGGRRRRAWPGAPFETRRPYPPRLRTGVRRARRDPGGGALADPRRSLGCREGAWTTAGAKAEPPRPTPSSESLLRRRR